jgi:DHA1 family tetracycline resistance protein-like MFS transporter
VSAGSGCAACARRRFSPSSVPICSPSRCRSDNTRAPLATNCPRSPHNAPRATALWMIYLSRVIDGATAGNLSLAQAYIADHTAPENRARSFALIGIAFGLGFFVGPFLTGYLVHYSMNAPIYLAAAMSATSILCTLALLPGGRPPQHDPAADGAPGPGGRRLSILQFRTYAKYFERPLLSGLLLQYFCYTFSFSTFTSGFALFAERTFHYQGHPFTPREIGYLFAYVGLLGIILQGGLIGRLVRRVGEQRLAFAGFVALCCGYVGLGLIDRIPPLIAVSTVLAFGNGVLRPTLSSLITQRAGRHEQGVVLGLTQSLTSISAIVAPLLGGFLISQELLLGWALVAATAAGLALKPSLHPSTRV